MWGPRLPSLVFMFLAFAMFLFSSARPDNFRALRTGLLDLASTVLVTVNMPVQAAADYVRAATGLMSLEQENARLREENAKLHEWYERALVMRAENDSLQKMLNIALPPQQKYVTARVLADPGNAYVRSLLVLAGRDNEVDKGQAVLAGDGLAGRIVESGAKASRILLLTDINSRVPVLVEGSGYHAILAGNNTDTPVLDHLPLDSTMTEGARIITSGRGGFFPYGLPVGRTVKMENGEWGVEPFSEPDMMTFVRMVSIDVDPNVLEGSLTPR
jgi:rod shape-determining protein MreC